MMADLPLDTMINRNNVYKIICILFVVFLLQGCEKNNQLIFLSDTPDETTPLIDEFISYQTVAVIEKKLTGKLYDYKKKLGKRLAASKTRPPFNMDTIIVKDYSHLGFTGELTLIFFNNRLMETTFSVPNIEEYIKKNSALENVTFNKKNEAYLSPFTRVWFFQDFQQNKNIGWEDVRLAKEVALWIEKFS